MNDEQCGAPGDRGDHFPLLPEEVDELVVRVPPLDQDVLGVVGECDADNTL